MSASCSTQARHGICTCASRDAVIVSTPSFDVRGLRKLRTSCEGLPGRASLRLAEIAPVRAFDLQTHRFEQRLDGALGDLLSDGRIERLPDEAQRRLVFAFENEPAAAVFLVPLHAKGSVE